MDKENLIKFENEIASLFNEGKIKDVDLLVLAAFGAGFTWASAIMKW